MSRVPVAIALLLLLPTAVAVWNSSAGSTQEPSTVLDQTSGHMFLNPYAAPGPQERVYLDLVYTPFSTSGLTPHYEAVLAAWKDCNQDGIMGSASGEVYASIFLLSTAVCPVGARHNDGTNVREVLWIGPGAVYPHYHDPDAAVWVDPLLPGDPHPGTAPKTATADTLAFNAALPRWIGSALFAPEPARATAYARIGPTSFVQGLAIPGQTSAYGAEVCLGFTSGVLSNWDCDAANWPGPIRVYEVYQLRDIDCTNNPC